MAQANRTAEQVRADSQSTGQAEYERIVNSAAAEVALSRQRAIDEAAERMGEIVLDVVERIIGREVNDRGPPRPDRRSRGRAARRRRGDSEWLRGAPVNPTLQGYAAEVVEEVDPEQLPVMAAEFAAIERLVLATPLLHAALTRHRRDRFGPGGDHA